MAWTGSRRPLCGGLIAAVAAAILSGGAATAQPAQPPGRPPPPAPVAAVVDDYFGAKVTDNYRWMEAQPEPQFRALLEGQDAYARGLIAGLPGHDAIAREIAASADLRTQVLNLIPAGGRQFYVKRAPGAQTGKLYVRDAASGRETLLVDPSAGVAESRSIDAFFPSPHGRLAAYVVSQAGSEDGVLHLIDAGSGRALPDVIDRGGFASVGWLPDETGFFYTRTAKLAPGAPQSEKLKHLKVFLHRLGDDLDTDRMVLDGDHLPFAFASELALPSIAVPPGTGRALAVIANGTQPEQSIYQAPLADLLAGHAAWTSIADQADGVSAWAAQGRRIYLLTHKNAARYRVVAEDFNTPGFAAARTMVPEARGVLTAIVASSEALYVAERDGGGMNLYRLPHGGSKRETVATPFKGTIYPPTDGDGGALYADPLAPGAAFALESWARAPQWFVYAPGRGAATDTGVIPPFSRDLSAYETTETQVTSPDGAVVPLSIVHRRGLKLDGARPTLLEGYGNFAVPMDPTFRPSVLTWLDHGGVYAMAHVRGGGELGEPWHRGGMLTAKGNSVTDFIACAEALIARGYTSPSHLAAEGSSGGGLTVGDAAVRRPDLFRAIVLRVPGVNPLRFEQLRVGPALVSEYGSVTNAEQVRTLMAVDPYANLKDGVSYPAALITAGFNDPRILPWMPAKFAARLQAASSSGRPVLLRIEFEGGHGPGSTAAQGLAERADEYAFLLWQLGADSAGRH